MLLLKNGSLNQKSDTNEIANVEKNPLSGYPEAVVNLAKRSKNEEKNLRYSEKCRGDGDNQKVLKEHGSRKGVKLKRQKNPSQLALFKEVFQPIGRHNTIYSSFLNLR